MQIIRKFDSITETQIQISRAVVPRGMRFFFCWKEGPLKFTVIIVPSWVRLGMMSSGPRKSTNPYFFTIFPIIFRKLKNYGCHKKYFIHF
jgi:hypothetical protein